MLQLAMRRHACGVDRVTRAVDPFLKHRNVKIEFNYCQFYPCLYDNTHVSWTPGLGDDTHVSRTRAGMSRWLDGYSWNEFLLC